MPLLDLVIPKSTLSKDEIVQCLLKRAFSVHAEVEQFLHGLNSVGELGHLLMGSPKLFGKVLTDCRAKLNVNIFKQLYNIEFSNQGSNQKDKEEKTVYCFELFLQDLEEGLIQELTLEDLLIFITGADAIPPLGFDYPIVIAFKTWMLTLGCYLSLVVHMFTNPQPPKGF